MYRPLWWRRVHHSQTRRVHTSGIRLRVLFDLVSALLPLGSLLLLALVLLHLDVGALLAVVGSLVVQLVVLGYDLGLSALAVAAAAGAVYLLAHRLADS